MTIRLLCENLAPRQLREHMHGVIESDPEIRRDIKSFVKILCVQASSSQTFSGRGQASSGAAVENGK